MADKDKPTRGSGGGEEGREVEPQIIPNIPAETAMFTTTALIEANFIRQPVPSFLRDRFFSTQDFVDADAVQIDTFRGGKYLAPYVLPLEGQVIGRREPFTRAMVEAPLLAPARVITLREARKAGWGETPYNYKSPVERVAALIAKDTQDIDDEIARREEQMCASCLFNGWIDINYRTKTAVRIDYGFTNKTALAKLWSDPTADPLADLAAAQSALNANGYSGNVAIYAPNAWTALWNNQKVKDLMKNTVGFVPLSGNAIGETPPTGVTKAPDFFYPTMQNWIYSGTYSSGGTAVPYVPPGCVLIGSSNVSHRMVYGSVTQIEQTDGEFHTYLLSRVPKFECNVNKNFYMLTLSSKPVPVPTDLLSWSVLTGAA